MWVGATGSSDWAVAIPLVAAVLGAGLALVYNLYLKRRDEKRELRALVRLLDDELAALESALEAFRRTSVRSADSGAVRRAAIVVQGTRSGTVWDETKLPLAQHLSFDDWDLLRDVYAVIRVVWLEIDSPVSEADVLADDILVAFNAESVAPRLLKVIAKARSVCRGHLGGTSGVKVPLSEPDGPQS